jgi:hypothetical protein
VPTKAMKVPGYTAAGRSVVSTQNLSKYGIQVVLLDSFKNTLEVLEPFILKFKSLLIENKLTEIYTIIKI